MARLAGAAVDLGGTEDVGPLQRLGVEVVEVGDAGEAQGAFEVALDQGRIHVPGTDGAEALLELELELLQGPEAALHTLADALRAAPGAPLALTPSDASKAQRGLALWQRAQA